MVSLDQEGQSRVPGNIRELWLCLGHGSVLTQKGLCLSGLELFLSAGQPLQGGHGSPGGAERSGQLVSSWSFPLLDMDM